MTKEQSKIGHLREMQSPDKKIDVVSLFSMKIRRNIWRKRVWIIVSTVIPPTTKIVNLDGQIKICLDKGNENVFVANSLEELGNKIGVNPDVLQKTVDEYNKFCEKGHDDLFVKNPKFLHPVKQPKFYAFRISLLSYQPWGESKSMKKQMFWTRRTR